MPSLAIAIAAIKAIWVACRGWKTYLGAAGLLALGVFQIRNGIYEPAIQSILTGIVVIGIRDAIAAK